MPKQYESDVVAAIEYMKANYHVTKIGLFGYSMGGRIALEMGCRRRNSRCDLLAGPATKRAIRF